MNMQSSSLFPALAVALTLAAWSSPAAADAVGSVSSVQNQAKVGGSAAAVGTPVHMGDRLQTGANSRLQVTFVDKSQMTLGENASVVVDKFAYSPKNSTADVVLSTSRGALRFAGGAIENMRKKNVVVNTPNAALAVRGTHFWAGPTKGKYGVLLLSGNVRVSKR